MKKILFMLLIALPLLSAGQTVAEREKAALDWWAGLPDGWKESISTHFAVSLDSPSWADIENCWSSHELVLYGSELSDLSPVHKFMGLADLDISGTSVSDLSPLSSSLTLSRLSCRGVPLKSLKGVGDLSRLWYLDISGTSVASFGGLSASSSIKVLLASGSLISGLGGVSGLDSLFYIDVSNTKVASLAPLKGSPFLRMVNAAGSKVKDFGGLDTAAVEILMEWDTADGLGARDKDTFSAGRYSGIVPSSGDNLGFEKGSEGWFLYRGGERIKTTSWPVPGGFGVWPFFEDRLYQGPLPAGRVGGHEQFPDDCVGGMAREKGVVGHGALIGGDIDGKKEGEKLRYAFVVPAQGPAILNLSYDVAMMGSLEHRYEAPVFIAALYSPSSTVFSHTLCTTGGIEMNKTTFNTYQDNCGGVVGRLSDFFSGSISHDLSALRGETVELVFSVLDCSRGHAAAGAHFSVARVKSRFVGYSGNLRYAWEGMGSISLMFANTRDFGGFPTSSLSVEGGRVYEKAIFLPNEHNKVCKVKVRDIYEGTEYQKEYTVKTLRRPFIFDSCLGAGESKGYDFSIKYIDGGVAPIGFTYIVKDAKTGAELERNQTGWFTFANGPDVLKKGPKDYLLAVIPSDLTLHSIEAGFRVDYGPELVLGQNPGAPHCERGVDLTLGGYAPEAFNPVRWYESAPGGGWEGLPGGGGTLRVERDFDRARRFKAVLSNASGCEYSTECTVPPLRWASVESRFATEYMVFPGALSISGSAFSDAPKFDSAPPGVSPWLDGRKGVWSGVRSYAFFSGRSGVSEEAYSAWKSGEGGGKLNDLRTGGYFIGNFFDWSISPEVGVPDGWRETSRVTLTSENGRPSEEKNALGIYSSVIFGYEGHLVAAAAGAARSSEIAFTGFEDGSPGNFGIEKRPLFQVSYVGVPSAAGGAVFVDMPFDAAVSALKGRMVSARGVFFEGGESFAYDGLKVSCIYPHPNSEKRGGYCVAVLEGFPKDLPWSGDLVLSSPTGATAPSVKIVSVGSEGGTTGENPAWIELVSGQGAGHTGTKALKVSSRASFSSNFISLDPGKRYVFSCWVKAFGSLSSAKAGFAGGTLYPASGPVVEGWRRLEFSFTPEEAYPVLILDAGPAGQALFDDLRIFPEGGGMKAYVYDPLNYRLAAVLDDNNYASFYYYDAAGNLHLVKKETERGVFTIQESRSNLPATVK